MSARNLLWLTVPLALAHPACADTPSSIYSGTKSPVFKEPERSVANKPEASSPERGPLESRETPRADLFPLSEALSDEALFQADPFSPLSLEGFLPLGGTEPNFGVNPDYDLTPSGPDYSGNILPLDTVPSDAERTQLSLQFWQAAVPPTSGEPRAFSEYAEMARHPHLSKAGPFGYNFKLHSGAVFDDNITLSGAQRRKDVQFSLGPLARLQIGTSETPLNLGINYAGAASWFARTPEQRAYEQNLGIDGGWRGQRLKTGLRLGFQGTHSGSVDAGERVGRRVLYAGLSGSYPFGPKFSGECSADFTRARFDGLLGSREYRAQQYLNYEWSAKTQLGLGLTEGLLRPDRGQDQTYQQVLARLVSQPTGKLGLNTSFGAEKRHFNSGQPSAFTPVYTAAATWQATGRTAFSLEGRRRTFASASLEQQNYEASNVSLSAREMLSATLDATLAFGYEHAEYKAAARAVTATRKDDYCFSRTSIEWAVRKNCALGMFYEFSRNFSEGADGHPFRRNRVGLSMNLSF